MTVPSRKTVSFANPEAALQACSRQGLALEQVAAAHPDWLTPELCRTAVCSNGLALAWVPRHLRTLELCQLAVADTWQAFPYVPARFRGDRTLVHRAIRVNAGGDNLRFVPESARTAYLCDTASTSHPDQQGYNPDPDALADDVLLSPVEPVWKGAHWNPELEQLYMQKRSFFHELVDPRDYLYLYPMVDKDMLSAVEADWEFYQEQLAQMLFLATSFHQGAISADDWCTYSVVRKRYTWIQDPLTRFQAAVIDTYAWISIHRECWPYFYNPMYRPKVKRSYSGITYEDLQAIIRVTPAYDRWMARLRGVDPCSFEGGCLLAGLLRLITMEAELGRAYLRGELDAERWMSLLPIGSGLPTASQWGLLPLDLDFSVIPDPAVRSLVQEQLERGMLVPNTLKEVPGLKLRKRLLQVSQDIRLAIEQRCRQEADRRTAHWASFG